MVFVGFGDWQNEVADTVVCYLINKSQGGYFGSRRLDYGFAY